MIRVLVVEDSPVVREFLVHVLNSDPAIRVIETASNGEEALEAVEETRPDLITMDIHMPKMNGLETTRRIMETHPTPIVIVSGSSNETESEELPVVLVTALDSRQDRERGIDVGANAYIVKSSFDQSNLLEVITGEGTDSENRIRRLITSLSFWIGIVR